MKDMDFASERYSVRSSGLLSRGVFGFTEEQPEAGVIQW
jgi:hypothetical protein